MQNFQLKQAPAGYVPNVVTIDGREVARFKDPTISDWGNILYTLESDYTEFINQNKIQSDESIN